MDFELGRKIYNERCYFCHGYGGNAQTLASSFLHPPPMDFTSPSAATLSRDAMIKAIKEGRPGTAMQGFSSKLSESEIAAVVDFVRQSFMERRIENTRYHTVENGWPEHERYASAFPFALGEIALDTPEEALTPSQQAGKKLFMSACVTCHDRARIANEGIPWDPRAVSYPRGAYSHNDPMPDGVTGATPYARHDIAPQIAGLTPREKRGEALYQENCAFCHAADGTARNWIGSFLQPRPRDLTDRAILGRLGAEGLKQAIRNGVPGTTMPAWRGVLTEEQIEAVAAYITRVFYHPAPAAKGKRSAEQGSP